MRIRTVITSIVLDRSLVLYGLLLLALHMVGVLGLYRLFSEFDVMPHFWFGYVLSEYPSAGANSLNLQTHLTESFLRRGWKNASLRRTDLLVRLSGFLLIGGLFWEWAELVFGPLIGVNPDSFFVFPITLRNVDGALDVTGVVGATLAFLMSRKQRRRK